MNAHYNNNEISGTVIKHNIVQTTTNFAAVKESALNSSAKIAVAAAGGIAISVTMTLNISGFGINNRKISNEIIGITTSFNPTGGNNLTSVNESFKLCWANAAPIIIIDSGVVTPPIRSIPLSMAQGKRNPVKKKTNPIAVAGTAGLRTRSSLSLKPFGASSYIRTPTVNAKIQNAACVIAA